MKRLEIILGKTAGFCGGVTNSVKKSIELLDKESKLYCLGEIVHNKTVIDNLKDKGLVFIDEIEEIEDNSKVIIRAHGVSKEIYEEAKDRGIVLFDLTCPRVLKIHERASSLVKDGYYVILVGNKEHPEVMGTISYCNSDSLIIDGIDDIVRVVDYILVNDRKKIAVLSQTTYSVSKFIEITEILKDKLNDREILIENTICNATELRQKETMELSKKVEVMIIIGGKNSSNTRKLYEISVNNCQTYIIENVLELTNEIYKYKKIGIMAGASTPKISIDEVINFLNNRD